MTVEKSSTQLLTFTGVACQVTITEQVVFDVEVPGGKQTVNFPITQLPQVHALLSSVAADEDVADLIVAHTPPPEPEPPVEPEPEEEPTP